MLQTPKANEDVMPSSVAAQPEVTAAQGDAPEAASTHAVESPAWKCVRS